MSFFFGVRLDEVNGPIALSLYVIGNTGKFTCKPLTHQWHLLAPIFIYILPLYGMKTVNKSSWLGPISFEI